MLDTPHVARRSSVDHDDVVVSIHLEEDSDKQAKTRGGKDRDDLDPYHEPTQRCRLPVRVKCGGIAVPTRPLQRTKTGGVRGLGAQNKENLPDQVGACGQNGRHRSLTGLLSLA